MNWFKKLETRLKSKIILILLCLNSEKNLNFRFCSFGTKIIIFKNCGSWLKPKSSLSQTLWAKKGFTASLLLIMI